MYTRAPSRKNIFTALLVGIVVVSLFAGLFLLFQMRSVSAVRASDFNPGRIIDDAVFYNENAMSASSIQSFLNARVPVCDTQGTQSAGGHPWYRPDISRATLASYIRNGTNGYTRNTSFHAPPYVCLKDFKQNTPQVEAASGLCGGIPAHSNRSAAHIINDVAKACGINPQVLLVLLQKEQSLVSDTWPLNLQYQRATGFDCPDSAGGACNPAYNGFFRQVYSAARQFKAYRAFPHIYNYRAGRTNNIFWQTNGGNFVNASGSASNRRNGQCGYSRVYIENQATAALYIYTPYRPNGVALNNYPGAGDACSAYGNRNFWFMFSNWFGSTQEQFSYKYETLVGNGGVIQNNSLSVGDATHVVTDGNRIYNFYADTNSNTLRLAYWNGTRWSDRIMDGPGSDVPGATSANLNITAISGFNYNGTVQLFYYDSNSKSLRHIYEKNHTFKTETLDGTAGSIIGRNGDVGSAVSSMAYGRSGIQLFYYNNDTGDLEHTWWNPAQQQWKSETLDGTAGSIIGRNGDVGSAVSGQVYYGGIQLFYHNTTTGELIHTWWNPYRQDWYSERMDGDTNTVLGNYINAGKVIDTGILDNKLFVAYYDDASIFSGDQLSSWRLAYWSGSSWIQHTMEGGGDGHANPSVSMPISDISMTPYLNSSMQIFYKGASNQLRHSWVIR